MGQGSAALGKAADRMPALGEALTGGDGGSPIGRARALLLAKHASVGRCEEWILLARSITVRELRKEMQEARAAGRDTPPGLDGTAAARTAGGVGCARGAAAGGPRLAGKREKRE